MNKNKILILSLVILLLSLTLVSASDNNDTSTNPTVKKEQSLPLARGTTNDNKANINERNMIQLKEDDQILILKTCSHHKDYLDYEKKYLLIVSRRIK